MILDRLESAGFSLEVTGAGKLKVVGALNEKQRCYIREHKDELIMELRSRIPHCVKCSACRHFRRTRHPHLGKCAAGAIQTAPAGFWDDHLRGCGKYVETDRNIVSKPELRIVK